MKIITLEDHYATPEFRAACPLPPPFLPVLAKRGEKLGHDVEGELLDFTGSRIAAMDKAGIDFQVLSLTMPGTEDFPPDQAIPMAQSVNDALAAAIAVRPDRLAGFAAIPTRDPKAAVQELERAVTKLGFKGVNINGRAAGEYLDAPRFRPIFECAQALDVPVYLHPREPHPDVIRAYFDGYPELAMTGWGFAMETCTHFLRLVFSGLFDDFPKLQVILGHMAEGLPFWMHRLNDHTEPAAARRGLKKTPRDYLHQNMVATTSGNFFTPALRCTIDALGIDRVMFSVDWPYESNLAAKSWLDGLDLSQEDLAKLTHRNAERILRLG